MGGQDDKDKAPGTLTPDEVRDELQQMKQKLFNMPTTLSQMARSATGKPPGPGQPSSTRPAAAASAPTSTTQPPAEEPILAHLASMEERLARLERMVAAIHQAVVSPEE